jgi:predicted permease
MSLLHAIRYRLRLLLRRRQVEAERDEEFRFHRSLEEEEQRLGGLGPADARLAARKRFGNDAYYREEVRRFGHRGLPDAVARSLRHAARSLTRSPGFTLAAVLTLGLGIGGLGGVASVTYSVLLAPLPFHEPSRLVGIWLRYPTLGIDSREHSDAAYFTFQRLSRSLQTIGAYHSTEVNVGDELDPERVASAAVSAGFFGALGVTPIQGRVVTENDDRPGASAVVVLSEAFWRRRFGGDRNAIGRSIDIEGRPHQMVGVLPASATFPEGGTQLWTALQLDPSHVLPASNTLSLLARLAPDATLDRAREELQSALARMVDIYPDAGFGISTSAMLEYGQHRIQLHPLRDDVVGDVGGLLWVLVGTAAFVLLIACANVATLYLVRAEGRQREVAVRAALGAGHRRLTTAVLTESLILALLGGALGGVLAMAGIQLLTSAGAADIPRLGEVGIDGVVIATVAIITLLVGVGLSLLPARRVGRLAVMSVLRSAGRGATAGGDRQHVRQLLVAGQVALAFSLLAGSGLLLRSYQGLRNVEPGFDAERVLSFRIALPEATHRTAADVTRFYHDALARLAAVPGVARVGGASRAPLAPGADQGNSIMIEDRPDEALAFSVARLVVTTGDHFEALGIRLRAGRVFGPVDPDRALHDVVVSASFAGQEWGDPTGAAAVGRRIRLNPLAPWLTVVGVAEDVRRASLATPPQPTVYLPTTMPWVAGAPGSAQQERMAAATVPRQLTFLIRATGRPAELAGPVRAAMRELAPTLPLFDVIPMAAVVSASVARTTFTGWMLGAAAVIALVLGVIGVYGVIAYTVGTRTREIGLRLALGAPPGGVRWLVVRQGFAVVGAGMAAGLVLTVLLTGSLTTLLFGVSRHDPMTLLAVTVTLGVAALAASWIPAARAGRVDPAVTLASE